MLLDSSAIFCCLKTLLVHVNQIGCECFLYKNLIKKISELDSRLRTFAINSIVMRDINDVLKLFANEYNMDYCRHFDRIKSSLEYCNRHLKNFEKIHFRGGNETVIDEIISKLEEDIKGLTYVENAHDLQKITFFLVLNTDATYKYDLKSDQQICHVLGIVPQIPKCLLISIVWGLKLDKSLYECLSYTPSWFSIQFIEPAAASMKHLEPYDVLDKIENLVTAVFTNICRMNFRQIDVVTAKIILNKFYDHTMELLRQFYTPDIEKFSDWPKREFFKYSGFAIRHILKMVLFCFDRLECPLKRKVEDEYRIYEICTDVSPINDENQDGYSDAVRDILNKILIALLNTLQYNVMLVTIDVFMHWAEEDVNPELTLQADIGSYAYRVLARMATNRQFGHDVENHLKFIAIEPKTLKETIREASIGDILRKIESEEIDKKEKQLWLDELLTRTVIFNNDECLETVSTCAQFLSFNNCIQILDYVKIIKTETEDDISMGDMNEWIPTILTKALDNFKADQLIELILYEIRHFGKDVTFFQWEQFEQRCTVFFNKSVENIDLKAFLKLCFENPECVWQKFFNEACTSQQQAKNFCTLASGIKKFSTLYLLDLLYSSFLSNYDEKFYPHLLFEIHEAEIIDKNAFFKNFVYKVVSESLDSQRYAPLLAILKALSMIVHKTKSVPVFGGITAPVVVMIGQILDQCRWDLVTYSDLHDEIVRLSIDCIQMTNKTFLPVAIVKVKEWISNKVGTFRPLTQYYFQKYSLAANEQPKTFDEFLRAGPLDDDISIEKFLIKNYVRCTMKETEWLARSEILRPHISNMILLLESLVSDIGESAIKNFRHSIMNYANIVNKVLLPDVENDAEKAAELGFKILKILSDTPACIYEDIFMNFHATLLDVFEKSKPLNEEQKQKIKDFIGSMINCKGKAIFVQKFEEF